MPIIDVTLIGEGPDRPGLAAELAQSIGQVLGASEGTIWLTLTRRTAADYAENGPAPAPLPVFVRVLTSGGAQSRAADTQVIAATAGKVLGRPAERIHVIFEPEADGRVWFGGTSGSG